MPYLILLLLSLLSLAGCHAPDPETYVIDRQAWGDSAMVVSAHPLATRAGVAVLREGGNAVDAAIAVHFVLAVVYPAAGNLGGGGFMLVHTPEGEALSLDFRETAPAGASRDVYLDSAGAVIPDASVLGHRASGVPGSVAGMVEAHRRLGSLPWSRLLDEAICWAREGFHISEMEARLLEERREVFAAVNGEQPIPFLKTTPWKAGDLLRQPELAATLERLQIAGREDFYEGTTAQLILQEMERRGGWITAADLAAYRPIWRAPLQGSFRAYQVWTMPPPSSGGVALLQLLRMLGPVTGEGDTLEQVDRMHRMAEASRRVYADRATYLGDPDFVQVPVGGLLDEAYLQARMANFRGDTVTPSAHIRAGRPGSEEPEQTTHFSILDARGMAVAVTTTLNLAYGSKLVVSGAGFFLNNEMDDFSVKPGVPNQFGLIGGDANAIAPGKRMLSSMTPTILTYQDKPFLVVGTPGGSTIITTVFQIIQAVTDRGLSLDQAVEAPRFHHQWVPDTLWVEPGMPASLRAGLGRKGHRVVERASYGRVDAILRDSQGRLHGVADARGDDHAAGY